MVFARFLLCKLCLFSSLSTVFFGSKWLYKARTYGVKNYFYLLEWGLYNKLVGIHLYEEFFSSLPLVNLAVIYLYNMDPDIYFVLQVIIHYCVIYSNTEIVLGVALGSSLIGLCIPFAGPSFYFWKTVLTSCQAGWALSLTCVFPAPALEPALSPKALVPFFFLENDIRNQVLGTQCDFYLLWSFLYIFLHKHVLFSPGLNHR